MADREYEPGTEWSRVVVLFGLAAICLGSGGWSIGAGEGGSAVVLVPLGVLGLAAAVYHAFYCPYIVTLTANAAILEARARQIVIPWAELYSVELTPNRFALQMTWKFGRGKVVRTTAEFKGLTSMLTEIRRRSPGTALP